MNAKNPSLKGKVGCLTTDLAACKDELESYKVLKEVVDFFKSTVACEENGLDEILENCSARVKKHLKIIIENKYDKVDLQSCLKIVMSRMESHNIWAEILNMISKLGSEELRRELIQELGGTLGVEKKAETDDSAPSSTDTEDDANDLLKPKALVFEQKAADKSLEKAADKSLDKAADKSLDKAAGKSLDKATKVKELAESDRVRIQEQKKRAKGNS